MLIPMLPLLQAADNYGYGQAAFNMNSFHQIESAIDTHTLLRSPAILQGAEASNAFMGGAEDFMHGTLEQKQKGAKNIGQTVAQFAQNTTTPIALHLDHGKSLDVVKACIQGGYTSVMIDGSHLPYEDNVALTREVVKLAHPYGVTVEGELGVLAGVEDHVFSEHSTYTNPLQAIDFFKKTKCDALAISYGTCHGANKGKNARIRTEIAIAIKECLRHERIRGYLVSHGSSTVPEEYVAQINQRGGQIQDASGISPIELAHISKNGIDKINVDTDIRLATTLNLLELFEKQPHLKESKHTKQVYLDLISSPKNFDPRNYVRSIINTILYGTVPNDDVDRIVQSMKNAMMEAIAPLLVQFGSYRKSHLVELITCEQMAEIYKKEGI